MDGIERRDVAAEMRRVERRILVCYSILVF